MKIWIDGYEANAPQRLGSSKVAFGLLKNLEKIDHQNDYTILLPQKPLEDLPKERPGWKYKILRPKRLWTWIALPLALYHAKTRCDLFFSPTHYMPRFSPVKRVVTIFDLSFLHFPESFLKKDLWQLKNWTKFSIENADHIVTISKFSKKDIASEYKINKDKITVAYPGFNKDIFHSIKDAKKINGVLSKYKIGHSYIIYIGTLQPKKNLLRLIEAFSRILTQKELNDLNLVIVGKTKGEGKQGWLFQDILKAPRKLGIEGRVIFTGFVPTDDLPILLSGAKVFILPSLWEGFGIPVVEAMATGTPAIVSNTSALPEVAGSAGLLIDPYSVDQMEQSIRLILTDSKLRQRYSEKALLQAKKFSWEKMARTILKVFERV